LVSPDFGVNEVDALLDDALEALPEETGALPVTGFAGEPDAEGGVITGAEPTGGAFVAPPAPDNSLNFCF
jgi:hypothetical protein